MTRVLRKKELRLFRPKTGVASSSSDAAFASLRPPTLDVFGNQRVPTIGTLERRHPGSYAPKPQRTPPDENPTVPMDFANSPVGVFITSRLVMILIAFRPAPPSRNKISAIFRTKYLNCVIILSCPNSRLAFPFAQWRKSKF